MLAGQKLASDGGFQMIRIDDAYTENPFAVAGQHGVAKPIAPPPSNFQTLKKWCRDNCSGIWGYTPTGERTEAYLDGTWYGNRKICNRHYFAFVDEQDILMVTLFLGLGDEIKLNTMWPAQQKFNVFVPEDLL